MSAPPLERDAELGALDELVTRAAAGSGGVIVIEGPAGIGKTLLLDHARQSARARGFDVASARGASLEHDFSFGAVRQLFEPLVAQHPDPAALFAGGAASAASVLGHHTDLPASSDSTPGQVLHGLYWLTVALAEHRRPLVLLCDDAHWFDIPSLRFVAYLTHRIADLAVAVVVGTRPHEAGPDRDVFVRIVDDRSTSRLHPSPLSRPAVGQLVRRSLDETPTDEFCDAIATASNGNPFLVGELVRAANGDAAATTIDPRRLAALDVDSAVLARLGQLAPNVLDIARSVAVLGNDAHLRHVAALAQLDVDEAGLVCDQLLRAEVLTAERPLTFVHPLVRSAIYNSMLPGQRSALHRRATTLLAAEDAPPDRLAIHVMAVEPARDAAAVDILVAAAELALAQGATDVAIAQFRRALLEPPPAERRLGIVLRLGVAESLINDAGAIDHLGDAVAQIAEPTARLKLATAKATVMSMWGRSGEAVTWLDRLGNDLGDDPSLRLQLLAGINIAGTIGPTPPATVLRNMQEVVAALAPDADAPGDILAVRAYAGACLGERSADVTAIATRALAVIDERDPMLPLWFHLPVAALSMVDRDDLGTAAIERGLTAARRAGAPAQVSVMLFQRSTNALRAGDLDDAEEDSRASIDVCLDYGLRYVLPAPLSVLVDVLRERDDLDGADDLLDRHGYESCDATTQFELLLLAARGHLRAAQGRWDDAFADLTSGYELSVARGCGSPGFVPWQANLAFQRAMAGRTAGAAELAIEALDIANAIDLPRSRALAQRALALVDHGRERELLDSAESALGALGARLEEARTAAVGSAPDTDHLAKALWLAERCGAARLVAQVRSRLTGLGKRPRVRPVSGVGALTASERRTVALAAEGQTNKEIAQALFVTVKTVETHLARAYQKLGITSRKEIRHALSA